MKINLTDPYDFTLERVRALIASKDDTASRQLRVSKDGFAYLSDDVGSEKLDGVLCRFETYEQSNDYTGVAAASDNEWVSRVCEALKANWPTPESSYIDSY